MNDWAIIPYRLKDKWGFCDSQKTIIIPCVFDEVNVIDEIFYLVIKNKKLGIVSKEGNVVLLTNYDKIESFIPFGWKVFSLNESKWGIFDLRGVERLSFKYSTIEDCYGEYFIVGFNSKWGLLNRYYQEIIPCEYEELKKINYYHLAAKKNKRFGKWGLIDIYGNEVSEFKYDAIEDFQEEFIKILQDGKWGLANQTGKVITDCKYKQIRNFQQGHSAVQVFKTWGFIDKLGEEVIPCEYDYVSDFNNGIAIFNTISFKQSYKEGWGFIDLNGIRETFFGLYDSIKHFKDQVYKVSLDDKNGFLKIFTLEAKYFRAEKRGWMISDWFNSLWDFNEGFAAIEINNKWGFINEQLEKVIPCIYDEVRNFSEEVSAVKLNDKWSVINKQGNQLCDYKYESIGNYGIGVFFDGYSKIEKDGGWEVRNNNTNKSFYIERIEDFLTNMDELETADNWKDDGVSFYYNSIEGLYDQTGAKPRINFPEVSEFNNDFFAFRKKPPKYGLINIRGKEIITCKYEDIGIFFEGLAKIKVNNAWGFIDMAEEIVIKCEYDSVFDFEFGYSIVTVDNKSGIIDRWGNKISEIIYAEIDFIFFISHKLIRVAIKSDLGSEMKYGLIQDNGKICVPCTYDFISFVNDNIIEVTIGNKVGFIDRVGTHFWED